LIRAAVLDIGGVLERGLHGREPALGFAAWLARWDERRGAARGSSEARFVAAQRDLVARGKDGRIGKCSEAEWHAALALHLALEEGELTAFVDGFWDAYLGELNVELLAYLRALRTGFRTALLSNSFVGAREREHARHAFGDAVDLIVYSHEEGVAKPDRAIYETTCKRLGVAPDEAVLLDDNESYVAGAVAAGMHAVRFVDNARAIGALEDLFAVGCANREVP
jgi:putative hydrolase of the HAD superfamily